MTEIKLTLNIPELSELVNAVKALQLNGTPYDVAVQTVATEAVEAAAAEIKAPVVEAAPAVPTKTYTFDEIAKAGADLAQTNPAALAQLAEIFKTYGVPSLVQLDKKYYPEVAEKLRGMGANI